MFYRVFQLSGRGRLNKEMLKILDKMDDRDAFFANADEFINVSKDPEYGQKVRVLRLWGDVFYERDEEFKEHLEDLNIDILLQPTKKNQGFANNEDSFFYLYMAIPNRLNWRRRNDLRRLHEEKIAAYAEVNGDTLLKAIHDENRKFYDRTDDRGQAFIKQLLAGEYAGYRYSKQLIGLYKNCEEAILAAQYRDEGNTEGYEECLKDIHNFATNTRLGMRWLKELHIELPKEEEEEPEETETESAETAEAEAVETEAVETEEPAAPAEEKEDAE
jgi:hypothetical protein